MLKIDVKSLNLTTQKKAYRTRNRKTLNRHSELHPKSFVSNFWGHFKLILYYR